VCSANTQLDKQDKLQVGLKLEALTWRCLSAMPFKPDLSEESEAKRGKRS
jgi:hypothetical protein